LYTGFIDEIYGCVFSRWPLAIRVYEQCRRNLAEDLGIEPMAETNRLYQRIKAGESL